MVGLMLGTAVPVAVGLALEEDGFDVGILVEIDG